MREKAQWFWKLSLAALFVCAQAIAADVTLTVLNPRGEIMPPKQAGIRPRVDDLNGKTIALIDNTKAGARNFLDAIQDLLKQKYPDAKFIAPPMPPGKPLFDKKDWYPEIVKQFDTFILATGD
jgi:hypothetical protein